VIQKKLSDALSRRQFLKFASLASVGLSLSKSALANQGKKSNLVYVGTYTSGKSEGIYLCQIDMTSGALKHVGTTKGVVNPSFLALAPNGRHLYAVNEVDEFEGKKSGALSAFAVNQSTGELQFLNQQASLGGSPCYVVVDQTDKFALVANYVGGNIAVLPLRDDGGLGSATDLKQDVGSSANPQRQEGPHAHCVVLDPTNRHAYACDLGTDKIMIFQFDARRGKLIPNQTPWVQLKAGAGPRHVTFYPNGNYLYAVNELDATVSVFARDRASGDLHEVQTVSSLPKDFAESNTSADIHISPNGRFLYCSNRGHDSIAAFAINSQDGKLTFIAHESTRGKTPRNFAIDPTGTFLLAANQKSDNVVTFRIDQRSGRLSPTGHVAEVPSPVCLKFS